ncbi:MAG TPA: ParA family protein [Rhodocyclaceae bacterium]|nr:ParA family protein [Rhodocyclaceae bacterium]
MRIAIFNQKGGVGKTITALNLAAVIARRGSPVCLVDLDPQAHLTTIRGSLPSRASDSVFALYQDNRLLADVVIDWPGIGRLVPAHRELIKVDSLFGKGPAILNRLSQALQALTADDKASVIIDCCPFVGVLSLNAVFAADRVLIPVSSDFLSMQGALQMEHTLKVLEPVLKRRVERRYVLTRFDRRRKMCFDIRAQMREHFGADVCDTIISENVSVAEAPALGLDVVSHAPDSRGARDYAALVDELTATGLL